MSVQPLKLHALPTLLTDILLVGHAKRADVVFTRPQFFALCAHMLNGNPANHFLMPYQDKDGKTKFSKAYKADADERMRWAWDTITGTAKARASIGFYPTNTQRQSRWAAMDFDAHDGDQMRARELALKAFRVLYQQPQLYVVLTTSAGDPEHSGWHLFVFSAEFYSCEKWTRLLKQVADQIGAPLKPGLCEIFPDGSRGKIGKGIRAPGTWNPKNGECGLILHETFTKLQPASLPKESSCSLGTRSTTREEFLSLPNREFEGAATKVVYLVESFGGERSEWTADFAITAPSTRHSKLLKLVGTAFFQCGGEVARRNAELQYHEANPVPVATPEEHLTEFDQAWAGMERQWRRKLSPCDREKFDSLTTDTERDAFRILRNWSQTDSPDFKAHCRTLSQRLGITLQGAASIRRRFCASGILRQTARYVPHKLAARYEWLASREPNRRQATLISAAMPTNR